MDNEPIDPRIEKALQDAFTYHAPDEAFLNGLENQLRAKLETSSRQATWLKSLRDRLQPVWQRASQPTMAAAGLVLLVALLIFTIELLPRSSAPGLLSTSTSDVPTPHSPLIGSLIWQTDGKYGYRMLRPAGWEAVDEAPDRLYLPSGSAGQADRINLEVLNLKWVADHNTSSSGTIAQWLLFEKAPTLEGWTQGLEQSWPRIGVQFTLLQTLPNAKIYRLTMSSPPDLTLLVGCVVEGDQPLLVGMNAYGAYSMEEYLRSTGLLEDFATMVGSIRTVAADPNSTDPPLNVGYPTGEPLVTPDLNSTAIPVLPAPTATPASIQTIEPSDTPDTVATVTANRHPETIDSVISPDGLWKAEVVLWGCIPVGGDQQAYEELKLIRVDDGTEQVVDSQVQNCGGLGAYGLGIEIWSADSRNLYYTTAREGKPDGLCWYWYKPLIALAVESGQKIQLREGPVSPNQASTAFWDGNDLVIWNYTDGEIKRIPKALPDLYPGPLAWAFDGQALVYLQNGADYCAFGQSALVRVDLASGQSSVLLESETPSFIDVDWVTPNRYLLTDTDQHKWIFDADTHQLTPAPPESTAPGP